MATLYHPGALNGLPTLTTVSPQPCPDRSSSKRKRCSRSVTGKTPAEQKKIPSLRSAELTKYLYDRDETTLRVLQSPRKHICQDCDKRSQQAQRNRNSNSKVKKFKVDRGQCIQPPVVLEIGFQTNDERRVLVHSPHLFVLADFLRINNDGTMTPMPCIGTMVSSLHPIKAPKTTEKRGVFVFSDMIPQFEANLPGRYLFKFTLMDMRLNNDCSSYAFKIKEVFSPAFKVEFHPKVPPTLESTQLTRDLRESGVNLKLKKTPKPRENKNKMSWNINGPTDSTPLPVSVMGPGYGSGNTLTDGTGFNSMNIRDRIKVSTWSLPMPTTSFQELPRQQTMAYPQYPPATMPNSATEYPQATAAIMPPAYDATAHGQHFGQLPLPMPFSMSGPMTTAGFWGAANTNSQYPHVTATASHGALTSMTGQYPDVMTTAGSEPSTNANDHYVDTMSVAVYGRPTHANGQYGDAMSAAAYETTVNTTGQYSEPLWPGYYPDRTEEGEQYFGGDAAPWKQ